MYIYMDVGYKISNLRSENNMNKPVDTSENYTLTLDVMIGIALLYFCVLINLLRWLCIGADIHPTQ